MEHNYENLPENKSVRDRVLLAIKNGETKMKPKWHFVLKATLFILGLAVVFLLLVYILSFSLFVAQDNGLLDLPAFGFHGLWLLFTSLPWLLITLLLLFLIVLQILVKQYAFSYHRPLFYSALGSLMFIIGGSFILIKFDFHPQFLQYAQRQKIPLAAPMYEHFCGRKFTQIHPGQIILFETQGFRMKNPQGEMEKVRFTGKTLFPMGIQFFIGDHVIVIGPKRGDEIEAQGVRTVVVPRYIQIRTTEQIIK